MTDGLQQELLVPGVLGQDLLRETIHGHGVLVQHGCVRRVEQADGAEDKEKK